MSDTTAQDFRDWLGFPETILFMEYIRLLRDDNDKGVHAALGKNEKEEAAFFNAGMIQLTEIMDVLPNTIIDDLKEKEKENENS
jgi:hypothetical protein